MFEDIASFLDRFNALKPPERYIAERVIDAVKHVCGITLRRAAISVRGKTVYINTSPAAKNEIMLRKSEILKNISREVLAGAAVTDIR